MPHAILKYNDGVIFFVEYSGEDIDYLNLKGIYLKDNNVNLIDYLDESVYHKAYDAMELDFAELQIAKDEYLREVQQEMRYCDER